MENRKTQQCRQIHRPEKSTYYFFHDAFFHDETKSTKWKINNQSAKTKQKFIKNHISTTNIFT